MRNIKKKEGDLGNEAVCINNITGDVVMSAWRFFLWVRSFSSNGMDLFNCEFDLSEKYHASFPDGRTYLYLRIMVFCLNIKRKYIKGNLAYKISQLKLEIIIIN